MNEYIFIIAMLFCIYALTVISLVSALNKKDRQFNEERKDYLNRIMAKDTRDYVQLSNKEVKKPVITDGDILGDDRFNGIVN